MLGLWLRWGYTHETFWDQTWRTLMITAEAHEARSRDAHNGRAWLAWNTVALDRTKRLPKFKSILQLDPGPKKRPQTWQEQMATMDRLAWMMERTLTPMKRMTDAGQRNS